MAPRNAVRQAEAELLAFALEYPEAYKDSPWGEQVVKVQKKVFVFFHVPSRNLNVTVKLPRSATIALGLPFVSPTGYGLGKSGWITATFTSRAKPPVAMLKQWIDESYRAVAPKTLLRRLQAPESKPGPARAPEPARAASRKR